MRRIQPLVVVVCGFVAAGVGAGCSVSIGGGGGGGGVGADDTTVEFPETGDALVVIRGSQSGLLTISGSRLDGTIDQIELDHPQAALTADFDGQGRPTSVVLDSRTTLRLTQNGDGTFDYALLQGSTTRAEGAGLLPDETVLADTGSAKGIDPRAQAGALDLLLCAGEQLERIAALACLKQGVSNAPADSQLARRLKEDSTWFDAATVLCGTSAGLEKLQSAVAQCNLLPGEGIEENECLDYILTAIGFLSQLTATVNPIIEDVARATLESFPGRAQEACAPPPLPIDTDGDGTSTDGDNVFCSEIGQATGNFSLVSYQNRGPTGPADVMTDQFELAQISITSAGPSEDFRLTISYPSLTDAHVLNFTRITESGGGPLIYQIQAKGGIVGQGTIPTEVVYGDYTIADIIVPTANLLDCPAPDLGTFSLGTQFRISLSRSTGTNTEGLANLVIELD